MQDTAALSPRTPVKIQLRLVVTSSGKNVGDCEIFLVRFWWKKIPPTDLSLDVILLKITNNMVKKS